uniref:Uncharacterized protein n=1 Tax=Pseudomonas monteilii TaxID=76759 RepID=A0A6B7PXL9_9PSED|nr:hypothetical protein [Pseudomonas monteilii]
MQFWATLHFLSAHLRDCTDCYLASLPGRFVLPPVEGAG